MNIYPAIDLKDGVCVRLYKGSYDQVTVYEQDPLKQAQVFADAGAHIIHVVDLDGAKAGHAVNLDIIVNIAKQIKIKVQTGGGIRSKDQIANILNLGISRVVIGSAAVKNVAMLKECLNEFGGERIVLALDVRLDSQQQPMLAVHGWQSASEKTLWQLLEEYRDTSLKHVLCTDISVDGTLEGPNFNLYEQCVKLFPDLQFQASGGVGVLTDLEKLAQIPVAGVIVGKALYENKFTVGEALGI